MSNLSTKVRICSFGVLLFVAMPLAGQVIVAPTPSAGPMLHVTLQDAIERAKKLSPTLATALTNAKVAAEAVVQTRAANLPNVSGNSQYLYTEGNGTIAARFIANNGVHEYIAQIDVHQAVSAPLLVEYRRSVVLHAVAKDQATIAERGLVVTVVQSYATLFGDEGKLKTNEETLRAAQRFLTITQERETNGDAAHADVLKARIQADDSRSALNNAQLALDQARVTLALLIFPKMNQAFDLVDDPSKVLTLPPRSEAQQEASTSNPELDAAQKNEGAARKGLLAARLGYLPSLTFDYFYGIDANQFAVRSALYDGNKIQNLGYSALASLSMPLFTWGATHSKVKAAKDERDLARLNLDFAHRKARGDFELYYNEAQVAENDLTTRQNAYADAVESQHLTLLQYQAGAASALEVVTSETTVETESSALYDAKTRYATALANLATLTGVL
ncbi:MAG: TolC family protein [Candidatus Micrarchaeaceae archaeon]